MFICVYGKNQSISLLVPDLKLPNEVITEKVIWRGGFIKSMVLEVFQMLLVDPFGSKRFGPTEAVGADYVRCPPSPMIRMKVHQPSLQ